MGWQLSSVGYGKIAGVFVFMIGLGVYSAYEAVNHGLNYAEVPATVTAITPLCAFDIDSPLYSGTTRWNDCGAMSEVSHEDLKAQKMVRKHEVAFTFMSPADGKAHDGMFTLFGRTAERSLRRVSQGATGMVWAHDGDPANYHYHSWPFAAAQSSSG